MWRLICLFTTSVLLVSAARAQEKDGPQGPPPKLWRATAFVRNGEVAIQISMPVEKAGPGGPGGLGPAVGSLPATMVNKWDNARLVTLGKTVQAFRANGELADAKVVMQALAAPAGVGVFTRTRESDPMRPDRFYSSMLREDVLMLVVNEKDIFPDAP